MKTMLPTHNQPSVSIDIPEGDQVNDAGVSEQMNALNQTIGHLAIDSEDLDFRLNLD